MPLTRVSPNELLFRAINITQTDSWKQGQKRDIDFLRVSQREVDEFLDDLEKEKKKEKEKEHDEDDER